MITKEYDESDRLSGAALDDAVPREAKRTVLLLAASVALVMTGFGIVLPVFGKRLGEFGAGAETLGLMSMGFAAAQFVCGPFLGALGDRMGRRAPVLLALGGFAVANLGLLLASNTTAFLALRVFEGAVTAGLVPSAMGVVGDIIPEHRRAQWIGLIMGSLAAGITMGPVVGGLLYDAWGYGAPFVASSTMGLIALAFAVVMVPETRPAAVRRAAREAAAAETVKAPLLASLPRPLSVFASLLTLDFLGQFSWVFAEPVIVFYVYDRLDFTAVQFGLIFSVYGLTVMLGQTVAGRVGDRFPRKLVIAAGFVLSSVLYFAFMLTDNFAVLLATSALTGAGAALMLPPLSASYLDIAEERYRGRVMGLKESAVALAGVAGPLAAAILSGMIPAHTIFALSGAVGLIGAAVALVGIPRRHSAPTVAAS
ncbi:MAG: MFS transporter, partial [Chloroflexi bacterium]|nr:MFS transporter [Chloroflexota bacterium]